MLRRTFLAGATAAAGTVAACPLPAVADMTTTVEDGSMPISTKITTGEVVSADGTRIGYDRQGNGPPLVFVVGAFNDRTTGAALAAILAGSYTVYAYDRRGRGGSGDTQPYAVEREVEDLAAIVDAADEPARILGFSSGAIIAMRAAAKGVAINRMALMEPPLIADAMREPVSADITARLRQLVESGRRGEAVELFQLDVVGIPREYVEQMRNAPFRPSLEAIAHTLAYDTTIIGDMSIPEDILPAITVPTLMLNGTNSPPWLGRAAEVVAAGLPDGRHISVPNLGHDLTEPLAPILLEFYAA